MLFPGAEVDNRSICVLRTGTVSFSVLGSRTIADLCLFGAGNVVAQFARWYFEAPDDTADLFARADRSSNINPKALDRFRTALGPDIDDDTLFAYVYGVLHSPAFRDEFAVNLKKEAPRVPLPASRETFNGFATAGQSLLDLHLDYEQAEPYPLTESWSDEAPADETERYRVDRLEYPKVRVDGKLVADRTRLVCNPWLTLDGIPERAHDYVIGTRSAIDWLVDRYKVKTDKKSGIRNDPNDWAQELGEPRYIVELVKRAATVSLGTLDVVETLPTLDLGDEAA